MNSLFINTSSYSECAKCNYFYNSLSISRWIQNIFVVFYFLSWIFYIKEITYTILFILTYDDLILLWKDYFYILQYLAISLIFVFFLILLYEDLYSKRTADYNYSKKKKKKQPKTSLTFSIKKNEVLDIIHLALFFTWVAVLLIHSIYEASLPIFSNLYTNILELPVFFVSCFNLNPLSLISLFNFLIISGFISINIYLFSEDFKDCLCYFLYILFCFCSFICLNPQFSLLILSLSSIFISALSMIFYGLFYFLFNFSIGIIYIFPLFFTDIEILWDFSNLSDFNESYWVPLDFWKNLMITRFPEGFDSSAANGGGPGKWESPILAYDPDEDYDSLANLLNGLDIHECPLPSQLLPHIYNTEVAQRLTIFAKLKSMDIRQDNYLVNFAERGEAAKIVENSFQTAYTTFKDNYAVYQNDIRAGRWLPSKLEVCRFAMQDLKLKTIIAQICIECDNAYKDYPSIGDKPTFPTISSTRLDPEFTLQYLKSMYGHYQEDQESYSRLHISNIDTMIAQEKNARSDILFAVQHSFWERHHPDGLFNPNRFLSHGEQVDIRHLLRAVDRLEYFPGLGRNVDNSPILRAVYYDSDSAILRAAYSPFSQSRVQFR